MMLAWLRPHPAQHAQQRARRIAFFLTVMLAHGYHSSPRSFVQGDDHTMPHHRSTRLGVLLALLLVSGARGIARGQVTLNPGDLIVVEEIGVDSAGGAVLRIDPATGGQTTIASGAPFLDPLGVAIEASGNLIVTDGFGGESILRVDPALGTIAVLSTGLPYLSDPAGVGLAVSSTGDIYVADFGALAVIRVDPVTGTQTLVSVGGMFARPTGLAIEADGNLIVVDRDAQGGNGAVIRVDPTTGAQTLVTSGGNLTDPLWVAIEANGNIVLTERTTLGGAVIRVNPTTGAQSVVSSGGNFSLTAGIAVDGDGDLIVVDFGSDTVIRVNPTTGAQTVVSSGGAFNIPVGVAVVLCRADSQCNDDNVCTTDRCAPGTPGADAFGCTRVAAGTGTVCRESRGTCDTAETCSGTTCPADLKSTAVCRPADGACDAPESCDGVSNACPGDTYAGAGTVCRASMGVCDAAESCSGGSPSCPPDGKRTNVCRAAAGPCDRAESCDGAGNACPPDGYLSGETVCRASLGTCDPTEYCSGFAPNCPYDARSTAVCRAAAGACDAEERCDGVGATCPANGWAAADTSCASDGNECTRDRCDGAGACRHTNELNNTVCGDDGFSCTDDVCFADVGQVSSCIRRRNDTRCDMDRDSCTVDVCDPTRSTLTSGCILSGFKAAGTGCDDRNACTVGDKCVATEGSATSCGGGTKSPTGQIECDGNLCTTGDVCNATTKACTPGTKLRAAGTACDDGNACSASDQCTTTGLCVGTAIPEGQVCDDRNVCTGFDACQLGICRGLTLPDATSCDDGNRCTLDARDQCLSGVCSGGPKKDCTTSTLFSPRCQPSTGLCCGKASKKGSTLVCR